jgi:hypothetical protein
MPARATATTAAAMARRTQDDYRTVVDGKPPEAALELVAIHDHA